MRRQVGADAVRIDTLEGYAGYSLAEPQRIDFPAVERAAFGAGYTLMGVEIQIAGRIVSGPGEQGEAQILLLEVDGTGQRFELEGDVPAGAHVRVRARASSWKAQQVRLEVLDYVDLGAAPGDG